MTNPVYTPGGYTPISATPHQAPIPTATGPTKVAPTANGNPSVTDPQGLANVALQPYTPAGSTTGAVPATGGGTNYQSVGYNESTNVATPSLPTGGQATYTGIYDSSKNYLDPNSGQAGSGNLASQQNATAGQATATNATAGQATADQANGTTATASNNPGAATYNAAIIGSMTPQAIAAQGQVDPRSLMQNQYSQLMNFPPNQVPDWAKGAVATANASLAAHGLNSSSVAGQAITSALMQAALPIASNDANVFATMNLTNLNNQQQAVIVNTQARVQTMMSDQAAINASQQFNATSKNQTNQFYSSLATQVSQFNAAQLNAISQSNAALNTQTSQFNAGQQTAVSQSNAALNTQTSQFNATQNTATSEFNAAQGNAISQFNAQLGNQMNQFNANNRLIVDQSNVQWQRQMNTANTAGINQANNTNAANMLNISNTAMNDIWQQMRDQANYAFTAGQNDQNRAATFANTQLNSQNSIAYLAANYNFAQQAQLGQAIGGFASNLLGKGLNSLANGLNSLGGSGYNFGGQTISNNYGSGVLGNGSGI